MKGQGGRGPDLKNMNTIDEINIVVLPLPVVVPVGSSPLIKLVQRLFYAIYSKFQTA